MTRDDLPVSCTHGHKWRVERRSVADLLTERCPACGGAPEGFGTLAVGVDVSALSAAESARREAEAHREMAVVALLRIAAVLGRPTDSDRLVDEVRRLVAERDEARAETERLRAWYREQIAAVRAEVEDLRALVEPAQHIVRCVRGDRPIASATVDLAAALHRAGRPVVGD